MKLLILASSFLSTSVLASQPSVADLSKLSITPVEALKLAQKQVMINGVVYQQKATQSLNKQSFSTDIEIPSLVIGEVVNSTDGFTAYDVTGEIIVKLAGDVDLEKFSKDNNLTIKQAYKNFYILKSGDKANLLPLVEQLQNLPNVVSATIDLADKGINTH
ncbi:hypothetical protein CJF42_09805 [Pseudoalteromonas sp. NBT06-2]|uniref:hypothetical protein n=1 Tax=Pseudoalteromonas sp. NBT06-2 TaxID=2025950 RepID=UPI000BA5E70C|nr:hypothetical protein [Pseudoalteromonas sp. NBT06-2]PAJ74604.1 hypothetical protein CJF42_09805 [Pseudoalteromonas sp. NBT06-2]